MLEEIGQPQLETFKDAALNERDYGDLCGLNKDDARKRWGEKQVHIWRRSYDIAPPGGESLKDTAARVLPYYIEYILPRVMSGRRVLVSAHGNSLRALVMVLDHLDTEDHPLARDRDRRAAPLPPRRGYAGAREAGAEGMNGLLAILRHARTWCGHPRLCFHEHGGKAWMAGPSPAMTDRHSRFAMPSPPYSSIWIA